MPPSHKSYATLSKMMRHTVWVLGVQGWRKDEAHRTLMTLLMQSFAMRQSGSSGWSDRRRCIATTNQKLIYLFVDSESSADEDLKLLKYSRNLEKR